MQRLLRRYLKLIFLFSGCLFLCMWILNTGVEDALQKDLALRLRQRLDQRINGSRVHRKYHIKDEKYVLYTHKPPQKNEGLNLKEGLLPGDQQREVMQQDDMREKRVKERDDHVKEMKEKVALFHKMNERESHVKDTGHQEGKDKAIEKEGAKEDVVQVKEEKDAPIQIPVPASKEGPGELGKPVIIKPEDLTAKEKEEYERGLKQHAFNIFASDKISLDRTLQEVRAKECFAVNYRPEEEVPKTSVIIIFHNEAWSILLRTVHSVINRTPEPMLEEILLVDDFSDMDHLQVPLERYIARWSNVRLLRAPKRMGLVHARIMGTEAAVAPILLFLDSHCECAAGWLQPLVDRIVDDERNVVCPVIDIISDETMGYGPRERPDVGGFTWGLGFTWHPVPARVEKEFSGPTDAIPTPTMPGGLFAISKRYFLELGMYDQQLQIWGGENLEISFKIWMCGGRIEFVPCSHVGHIFRKRSPYSWKSDTVQHDDIMKFNLERVAEVWLDDYKEFYYQSINNEQIDHGDISEQIALRERLKCRSFDWYIKTVYPEQFIPSEALAVGEVRSAVQPVCVDARTGGGGERIGTFPCHGTGGNQLWFLSKGNEILRDDMCWDNGGEERVILYGCHGIPSKQIWTYREDNHIYHGMSGHCVELAEDGKSISMKQCQDGNERQVWLFKRNVK